MKILPKFFSKIKQHKPTDPTMQFLQQFANIRVVEEWVPKSGGSLYHGYTLVRRIVK